MQGGLLGASLQILAYFGAVVFCFILPGYGLALATRTRLLQPWPERLALAAALSLSIYPLLYLWTHTIGLSIGPVIAWAPGAAGLSAWLWTQRTWLRRTRPALPGVGSATADSAHGIAVFLLILALVLCRLVPVRDMVAPAWGDSVHHTMIVQLLLDHRGLFASWAPYAPLESFTYHFGFHSAIAVWATVTGQSAPQAVITGGQVLNVLAVLALYPLAVRLAGSRVAGIGALLVAGLVSQMPAMYVNWGRYTQLTAQVILPIWLWTIDIWWAGARRPSRRILVYIALLSAGLALTHYRVAILALFAGSAWGIWSLWQMRSYWREWTRRTVWLLGTGVIAVALILPWAFVVRTSRLAEVAGALAQRSTQATVVRSELTIWTSVDAYYSPVLWLGALAALLLALWRRPRLAVPLLLWGAFVFVAANPFLLGMAGTGIVTNFLLTLALYIPLSLIAGWLLGEAWHLFRLRPVGRVALAAVVSVAALFGIGRQLTIVDPAYQMVTRADIAALDWVDTNISPGGRFLVNSFLAYNDSLVAGSDAGWWLPYYTRLANNVPPILYSVETLSPDTDRTELVQLVADVEASLGDAEDLRSTLCRDGITHVYLGDRQGTVGLGDTQLLPPAWLQHNTDFRLLHQAGNAQVWSFDRTACATP